MKQIKIKSKPKHKNILNLNVSYIVDYVQEEKAWSLIIISPFKFMSFYRTKNLAYKDLEYVVKEYKRLK